MLRKVKRKQKVITRFTLLFLYVGVFFSVWNSINGMNRKKKTKFIEILFIINHWRVIEIEYIYTRFQKWYLRETVEKDYFPSPLGA